MHLDFEALSSDWDALADRLGAAPFLRPGWIAAWWSAFGKGELELLTSHRGGHLQALLPVVHRRGTAASPSNWETPQFGLLSTDHSSAEAILNELFARRADLVSVGFLRAAEPDLDELRTAAEAARYRVLVRTLVRSPFVVVQGDWRVYERALSGNLRRDVGRCRRRLSELGRVSLDVTYDVARLAEAFTIERSGWKGQYKTAISSRPETAEFYTRIASWAAERGWLRLIFLRLDDRAIAFHLALEESGAYLPLKGGFDSVFRRYSPGQLIIRATLERAFSIGLKRYDFLGGFEHYKRRWATEAHDRVLFQAFAPTPRGLAIRAAYAYGRPLAKRVLADARRL
jgi:CelD/BcsL family acetyltransferase involved in cellulose biosynthesis